MRPKLSARYGPASGRIPPGGQDRPSVRQDPQARHPPTASSPREDMSGRACRTRSGSERANRANGPPCNRLPGADEPSDRVLTPGQSLLRQGQLRNRHRRRGRSNSGNVVWRPPYDAPRRSVAESGRPRRRQGGRARRSALPPTGSCRRPPRVHLRARERRRKCPARPRIAADPMASSGASPQYTPDW